jgi:DNA repair protein RadC
MPHLTNSQKCVDRFREILNGKLRQNEVTYIIYLNDKREPLFHAEICAGRYKDCPFDKREAIQYALNIHSDYIIIAHNHTSGEAEPSEQDISFTIGFKALLAELYIVLVDHLILTPNDYYSFSDHGFFDETGQKSA